MNAPDLYTTAAQVIPVFVLALIIEARIQSEPMVEFGQIAMGLTALLLAEVAALRGVALGHREGWIDGLLWVGLSLGGLGFLTGVVGHRLTNLATAAGLTERALYLYGAIVILGACAIVFIPWLV
jgi:hypothetical protein